MKDFISGIQQIGIGVEDAKDALLYYKHLFGMTTLVFDDLSEARLMTKYTGGNVYQRQAMLSMNLNGGGGFEVWQYTNRKPLQQPDNVIYGDIGIYAAKLKCADVAVAYQHFRQKENIAVSKPQADGMGRQFFYVTDAFQNRFQLVEAADWFQKTNSVCGGVCGAVIGVSNMEKAVLFYKALLNIERPVVNIIQENENGEAVLRKVLLRKEYGGKGAFAKLLGGVEIELVQCLNRAPQKIYANRFWGDCGFIHLCFDVFDMCGLKKQAQENGFCFTVDSVDSFEMENASGRFCYVEDPDGTLIELVETHKVPLAKKWGLYLNLKKRNLQKPLPDWMIKMLALSKVK